MTERKAIQALRFKFPVLNIKGSLLPSSCSKWQWCIRSSTVQVLSRSNRITEKVSEVFPIFPFCGMPSFLYLQAKVHSQDWTRRPFSASLSLNLRSHPFWPTTLLPSFHLHWNSNHFDHSFSSSFLWRFPCCITCYRHVCVFSYKSVFCHRMSPLKLQRAKESIFSSSPQILGGWGKGNTYPRTQDQTLLPGSSYTPTLLCSRPLPWAPAFSMSKENISVLQDSHTWPKELLLSEQRQKSRMWPCRWSFLLNST